MYELLGKRNHRSMSSQEMFEQLPRHVLQNNDIADSDTLLAVTQSPQFSEFFVVENSSITYRADANEQNDTYVNEIYKSALKSTGNVKSMLVPAALYDKGG
eukprot:PhF_6_TR30136/c0_g1_i5/m.44085